MTTPRTPLTGYQWKLFGFLSVATFFEGYDFMALTQILPKIMVEWGFGIDVAGVLLTVISVGTVVAFLLVRKADQLGRRRVLMITILGYALFSFLTSFAPNIWAFGALQLLANVFLIAEWAISMVYAAEEFPADRRATIIGVIQAVASFGAITCTQVVPLLLSTSYGWRSVYVVGTVPLMLIAFARRGIRETRRFETQVKGKEPSAILRIFRTPYRTRMVQLAVIWCLTYICNKPAVFFWPTFAATERHFTAKQIGACMGIATLVALPLAFFAGKLLDVAGRRLGATVIFLIASAATFGGYTLQSQAALTVCLVGGIFATTAVMPVLNAYMSELFPTDLRGDAFAWSNNLLGRIGYVLSPVAVGFIAKSVGLGPTVASTAVFPVLALLLILWLLPETRGLELEASAALGAGGAGKPAGSAGSALG